MSREPIRLPEIQYSVSGIIIIRLATSRLASILVMARYIGTIKKLKRAKTPEMNRINRAQKKYLNRAKDFAKV